MRNCKRSLAWFLLYVDATVIIVQQNSFGILYRKKSKRKVQGVPQSQTAALLRHQEEKEADKTKQAQIEQMYEKH